MAKPKKKLEIRRLELILINGFTFVILLFFFNFIFEPESFNLKFARPGCPLNYIINPPDSNCKAKHKIVQNKENFKLPGFRLLYYVRNCIGSETVRRKNLFSVQGRERLC